MVVIAWSRRRTTWGVEIDRDYVLASFWKVWRRDGGDSRIAPFPFPALAGFAEVGPVTIRTRYYVSVEKGNGTLREVSGATDVAAGKSNSMSTSRRGALVSLGRKTPNITSRAGLGRGLGSLGLGTCS